MIKGLRSWMLPNRQNMIGFWPDAGKQPHQLRDPGRQRYIVIDHGSTPSEEVGDQFGQKAGLPALPRSGAFLLKGGKHE